MSCRIPLLLGLLLAACAPARARSVPQSAEPNAPLPIRREFRGVWVASVANIDWPSRPGLPVPEQQTELLTILDRAAALRMNAIILQVRPAADALYRSPHEPWSEYLTGEQGRAPESGHDPLEFAVTEAHRRGLELHAWFNPYRARHPSAHGPNAPGHLSRTRPELVKTYGRYLWLDPGEPAVQDQTVRVILDVVRRYDIDGVHLDDYFYPYPETDSATRQPLPFPDSASYSRYQAAGGRLGRDDWRRDNVDRLVQRLYREIKEVKPWVRFGISPFSIWRAGFPAEVRGFDPYERLYADSRKWLMNGWVDYFAPQLYQPIAHATQAYPILLRWWIEQNVQDRHIWPGLIPNRVGNPARDNWPIGEILGQINVTRAQPGATGHIHFSMRTFLPSADPPTTPTGEVRDTVGRPIRRALADSLRRTTYAEPALVPATPWLGGRAPGQPRIALTPAAAGESPTITLHPDGDGVWLWTVRTRWADGGWSTEIVPGWRRTHPLPTRTDPATRPERVVVSAVDRLGNEGPTAALQIQVRPPNKTEQAQCNSAERVIRLPAAAWAARSGLAAVRPGAEPF
jgi:uncharacterized lipoprotein YddW (UPF0748 family)